MEIEVIEKIQLCKGSLRIKLEHEDGRVERYEGNNIVVAVGSNYMAELMRGIIGDPLRVQVDGLRTLAVGTGGIGWDLQNPPAATVTQTSLENELFRKEFDNVNYIDTLGNVTLTRTNIIDLTTVFNTTQANGALVEMGLFGGANALLTNNGSMLNYYTMPVINKVNAILTIIWRLVF